MGIAVFLLIVFVTWFVLYLSNKIEKRQRIANYNKTSTWKKIKLKDNLEELAENLNLKDKPQIKKGKRGGRYTEDKTKDGRPYRRYF